MKRLVVCSDGTWNTADNADATNVVRTVQAVKPNAPDGTPQVVFYDQGVGTRNWIDRWIGGITGSGLGKNVQDAYRFLLHNYEEGDEIYLFGFSRGSYTVRSTAGLIRNCGLLRKAHIDKVDDAYELYKRRDAPPKSDDARPFRESFSREVEIKFIGVWDTVGAMGIPAAGLRRLTQRKYKFHDVKLSRIVKHGFQAIAIDERRKPYAPSPWKTDPEGGTLKKCVNSQAVYPLSETTRAQGPREEIHRLWEREALGAGRSQGRSGTSWRTGFEVRSRN